MHKEAVPWLPYVTKDMISGVRGFNLCAYLVALEGWRRGLTLRWYLSAPSESNIKMIGFNPMAKTFSLTSKDKTHYFFRSRGDKVANEAVDICGNKQETKDYLSKSGLPTPGGRRFTNDDTNEEVVQYALSIGFPLVVKPTFGSLGKGVSTNIQDEESLKRALEYVRSELNYTDIIVERFFVGEDIRVYVVGDKIAGAIKRIPANIVGDGVNSIKRLIEIKNQERKKNPHLSTRLILVDEEMLSYIHNQGYSTDSILQKDERIFLKGIGNVSSGGDSVDITNELSTEVKNVAIDAVNAIPGLHHAGVDLIVGRNRSVIIEINPTAGISLHTFPSEGSSRNVPAAIIDYYFPETQEPDVGESNIYFDFKTIYDHMMNNLFQEIRVTQAPIGKLFSKKYIVTGKVQGVGYRQWIRKKALQYDLHGYTRYLDSGKVVVVVAGINKDNVDKFKRVCFEGPVKAEVKKVTEYDWNKPIKVGFEIRKTSEPKLLEKLKNELQREKIEKEMLETKLQKENIEKKKIVREINRVEQENEAIKRKYTRVVNSRSWRYTQPIRNLFHPLKEKK